MTAVADLITNAGERFEGLNTYPSINRAIDLIAKRMFVFKSDMITGSLSVSLTAEDTYGTLPTDFWGLMEDPYLNGYLYRLKPLPHSDYKLRYTTSGTPEYFQVKNNLIYIYPPTVDDETINGDYFQKPTRIVAGSTIPWNGLFDDVIIEYMIEADKITPASDPQLRSLIIEMVDPILALRDRKEPVALMGNGTGDIFE